MALISHLTLDNLACDDDLWPTDSSVLQEEVDGLVAEWYDGYKPGSDLARGAFEPYFDEPAAVSPALQTVNDVNEAESDDQAAVAAQLDEEGYEQTVLPDAAEPKPKTPSSSVRDLLLDRERHIEFLRGKLERLPMAFQGLDANRPWLCYYIVHSLCLLGVELDGAEKSRVAQFLARCQSPQGGFAGGPGQLSHVATTYAAVLALAALGTREAYDVVDRPAMGRFLSGLAGGDEDGSVRVHADGEADVRAAYCACAVAHLLALDDGVWAAFGNTAFWLSECQSYDGGFGGVPGAEAHGGYTYCALAALCLLRRPRCADLEAALAFASRRQMRLSGGFQGRANKLVDACYSYWLGALFPLLRRALLMASGDGDAESDDEDAQQSLKHSQRRELPADTREALLCCPASLQSYLLVCCQHDGGGLIDKPGKRPDLYHTCYALSGLSVAQHRAGAVCVADCPRCSAAACAADDRASSALRTPEPEGTSAANDSPQEPRCPADGAGETPSDEASCPASLNGSAAETSLPPAAGASESSGSAGVTPAAAAAVADEPEHQKSQAAAFVLGSPANELVSVDPLLNICVDKAESALQYFRSLAKR